MALTTALLISFGLMSTVRCLPGGPVTASAELCSGSIMPKHHTTAQKTTAPYKINVPTCYKAGSPVKVTVEATSGYYNGLFMLARINGNSTAAFGTFTVNTAAGFKLVDCYSQTGSAVAHSCSTKKHTSEVFMWIPPSGFKHNIKFQATIVNDMPVFWVDIFSSELSYSDTCVEPVVKDPESAAKLSSGAEAIHLHAGIFVVVSFVAAFFHLQ